MYKIIDEKGTVYTQYVYSKEADFEKMIVDANGALRRPVLRSKTAAMRS